MSNRTLIIVRLGQARKNTESQSTIHGKIEDAEVFPCVLQQGKWVSTNHGFGQPRLC